MLPRHSASFGSPDPHFCSILSIICRNDDDFSTRGDTRDVESKKSALAINGYPTQTAICGTEKTCEGTAISEAAEASGAGYKCLMARICGIKLQSAYRQ